MTKPGELSLVEETPDFLVWVVSFNKATWERLQGPRGPLQHSSPV